MEDRSNMGSKEKKSKSSFVAQESRPRDPAKNTKPQHEHGPVEAGKHPENAQRKEGGMHETRRLNPSEHDKTLRQ